MHKQFSNNSHELSQWGKSSCREGHSPLEGIVSRRALGLMICDFRRALRHQTDQVCLSCVLSLVVPLVMSRDLIVQAPHSAPAPTLTALGEELPEGRDFAPPSLGAPEASRAQAASSVLAIQALRHRWPHKVQHPSSTSPTQRV